MKYFCILLISMSLFAKGQTKEEEVFKALTTYAKVLNHVEKSYYKKVNISDLIYTSLKAMLASLDPHSTYMTEEEYKTFNGDLMDASYGIGVEYRLENNDVVITRVYKESPADKAGVKVGMLIEKINEVPLFDKKKPEIDALLMGKAGSLVKVVCFEESRFRTFKMIRDRISKKPIESFRANRDITYIKIISFQRNTAKNFLNTWMKHRANHLIIDVRNNPGGYVSEAVDLADLFIAKGKLVSSKEREKPEEIYYAKKKSPLKDKKVVILINSETASAAEIFAAAMKEHKKAILIGERTYGKGSIQSIIKTPPSGAIKLTVALYYTPNNYPIQAKGVKPHIEVPKYFTIEAKEREENLKNIIKQKDEQKKDIYYPDYLKGDRQFLNAISFLNE